MTTLPEEAVKAAQSELSRIISEWERNREFLNVSPEAKKNFIRRQASALTAALPFLSVQGAVKKLEWNTPYQHDNTAFAETILGAWTVWDFDGKDSHVRGPTDGAGRSIGGDIEAAKAAAQSDFEARILSALEPSAARDLALEEGFRQGVEAAANRCELSATLSQEQQDKESNPFIRNALMGEIATAKALAKNIRTLSSPDHADAGKVEGDGWLPIESAPKDGTAVLVHFIPNEVPSLKPLICAAYWQKSDGLMKPGFWRVIHSVGPSFTATHWRHLPSAPSEGEE